MCLLPVLRNRGRGAPILAVFTEAVLEQRRTEYEALKVRRGGRALGASVAAILASEALKISLRAVVACSLHRGIRMRT